LSPLAPIILETRWSVLKLRAWEVRQVDRDAEDLVRLAALVGDVEALRSEMKPAERRLLGRVRPLVDPGSRLWRTAADPEEARAALLAVLPRRSSAIAGRHQAPA